jgi:hypothetical protein
MTSEVFASPSIVTSGMTILAVVTRAELPRVQDQIGFRRTGDQA